MKAAFCCPAVVIASMSAVVVVHNVGELLENTPALSIGVSRYDAHGSFCSSAGDEIYITCKPRTAISLYT